MIDLLFFPIISLNGHSHHSCLLIALSILRPWLLNYVKIVDSWISPHHRGFTVIEVILEERWACHSLMRLGILLLRWLSNGIPHWAEKLKVWIRAWEAVLILLKDLLRAIDSRLVLPIELEVNPELHEAIEILLWTISLNAVSYTHLTLPTKRIV